ncbi:hypothetical protein DYQ86_15870 [Acidobacteria bacterium AB60]|nr:hypothetical protein DYQ86_15870 [Acidobacteria bacterium AB60]
MTYLLCIPATVIAAAAFIFARARRHQNSDAKLLEISRPDLVENLAEFSLHVDPDRLGLAIGGLPGLLAIYRACGAIATLIARHARRDPSGNNSLAEQMFVYSICARLLAIMAIGETFLRKVLPQWPPVFTASLARLFCDMGFTLDAMEIHA